MRGNTGYIAILLWIILLLAQDAAGQSILDPSRAITQYAHDHWEIDDGLPVKIITALTQTRNGYLWVGTQEGLARFDGLKFRVFNKSNSKLGSNNISALHEARDGTLWIGTRGAGLFLYQDGGLKPFVHSDSLTSGTVSDIAEAGDTIWVSTFGGGLNQISKGHVSTITHSDGLLSNDINAIAVDPNGSLWIGTRGAGLLHYEPGQANPFERVSMLDEDISALRLGHRGELWIGTRTGHLRRRDRSGHITEIVTPEGLNGREIHSLYEDRVGSLWIGSRRGGLHRYRDGKFEPFNASMGLASDIVNALVADREGSLWIATNGGLDRLWNGKFLPFTRAEGLPVSGAYSIYEDGQNVLWVGTDGGGVARLKHGEITTFTSDEGVPGPYVVSLGGTRDGSLWAGTWAGGLGQYKNGHWKTYSTVDGLPSNGVFALYTDSSDNLWIGTQQGVARFNDGQFSTYSTAQGLSSNSITAIAEHNQGGMWIGTYDAGLNLLQGGRVVAHYGRAEGIHGDFVLSLYEDTDGVLWFSVREDGLYRLKDGQLTHYSTVEGLFNDGIQQILEDDLGNLWMSTNLGVFWVSKKQLDDYAEGRITTITSVVYDRSDGLKSREMNGGSQPAGWKAHDGKLWFPSNQGIVAIDPAHLGQNKIPPPVVVENISVDGMSISSSAKGVIHVGRGSQKFEFDYVGLSFIASREVHYQYRLEGEDHAWIDADTRRTAFYTNLNPGTYRFRVRAANSDGVWSPGEAVVNFYLEPFLYQQRWFQGLIALLFLFFVYAIYRWRISHHKAREEHLEAVVEERTHDLRQAKEGIEEALQQTEEARRDAEAQKEIAVRARGVIEEQAEKLREMDRVKTRFFGNISHEFRTPLTLNIGPLENALAGVYGHLSDTMRRQIEVMLRNSRRLLRLINQLLDLSRLESGRMEFRVRVGNLVDLVEGVLLSFTAFAEKRRIDLRFSADIEDASLFFDAENLEKVFFNLLSNAVKFTPENGVIEVSVNEGTATFDGQNCQAVLVKVRDTGLGIPRVELPHIFDRFHQVDGAVQRIQEGTGIGLALVKELVELHGGIIEVESEPGLGTTFTVQLRKGVDHFDPADIRESERTADSPSRGPMVEMAVFDDTIAEVTPDDGPERTPGQPSILVVDDNPDVRSFVADCLDEDHTIIPAHDGSDGLKKARSQNPDLIVSDVMMPQMNGYELCRAIKGDADLGQIPVILLTSRVAVEDKIIGLEAGADDYLAKPFNARELRARVGNLLHIRQQQSELRHINQELIAANENLREVNETKSRLLSIASHDMKNPLTGIREFANIIREELDPESHLIELMDLIYGSTDQMLYLITQLLDSSALEGGQMQLDKAPVSMGELAENVLRNNETQAEMKGQTLHLAIETKDPLLVEADPERIQSVMDNLISNAIKYSPHDRPIRVILSRVSDEIFFAVADEGPGLTPEDENLIFGKFQKLSAQPTGGESSSGLGLSIVKQLVELHGGRVWAENNFPGKGSTFTVALQALPPSPFPRQDDHPPRNKDRGNNTSARHTA